MLLLIIKSLIYSVHKYKLTQSSKAGHSYKNKQSPFLISVRSKCNAKQQIEQFSETKNAKFNVCSTVKFSQKHLHHQITKYHSDNLLQDFLKYQSHESDVFSQSVKSQLVHSIIDSPQDLCTLIAQTQESEYPVAVVT